MGMENEMEMNRYVTDGHIVTDGKSAMGIYSATDFLNSIIDRLEASEKIIKELACKGTDLSITTDAKEYLAKYK